MDSCDESDDSQWRWQEWNYLRMELADFVKYCCCFIPWLKTTQKDGHKSRSVTCGLNHMKKMHRLQPPEQLQQRREKIISDIRLDCSRILVLWGYSCSTEAISHTLKKYGKFRVIKEGWTVSKAREKTLLNTIVEFSRKIDAAKASMELQQKEWNIRSALLSNVVMRLADSEAFQPDIPGIATKIKVNKRYRLKEVEIDRLHHQLHSYGHLTSFLINNRFDRKGVVCEASYSCATHAYVAMLMTNGIFLCTEGRVLAGDIITVSIQKTDREREIFQEAKKCASSNHCCLPY